jgi:hypothetical protein
MTKVIDVFQQGLEFLKKGWRRKSGFLFNKSDADFIEELKNTDTYICTAKRYTEILLLFSVSSDESLSGLSQSVKKMRECFPIIDRNIFVGNRIILFPITFVGAKSLYSIRHLKIFKA